MISSKIRIKALMRLVEEECNKSGVDFTTSFWGSMSYSSGVMECTPDGMYQMREPWKIKRSKSGMTVRITFYDSDKPKSLDEVPKGIMGLLRNEFDDIFGNAQEEGQSDD